MSFLSKSHHLIYRHYALILLITVIASCLGGYFTTKLRLQSDLAELLPDSFESVKALNRIKEEVGGIGNLRIILESSQFGALKNLAADLEPMLFSIGSVNNVDYKNDVEFYSKNALLFLDIEELESLEIAIQDKIDAEKQKLNPLMVDDLFGDDEVEAGSDDELAEWENKYQDKEPKEFYTNDDSTILVIKLLPSEINTSLDFVQRMYDEVKQIVDSANPQSYAEDMKVYYGGNFKNRLDEFQVVKDDILGTVYYGLGGVFLLIVIYFRRLTGAILISLTLICSLAWTFGVTYFVIGSLNTITGFLFVILFGLGIDYGIHAFARYAESRKSGLSFEESIEKLVVQTGRALTTTAVTTSAAFFSLMFMDFKGFSELGFIVGVGMIFALIAMVVVLPAFITLLEKWQLLKIEPSVEKSHGFKESKFKFSTPIITLSVLLTLFGIYSAFEVGFEYDFTNLRAITKEREIVSEKTQGVFKLSESPAVILADSKDEVFEIVAELEKRMAKDTLSPTIKKVRTIFSLVPEDQPARLERIRSIRKLVDEEADGVMQGEDLERLNKLKEYLQVDEPFTWADFPEKDKKQFINKRGEIGNFVFVYASVALRDGKNAMDFRDDVGEVTTASGKVFHAASSNIILAEMLTIMIREGKLAITFAFIVVFLLVLMDFRSLTAALLVLTPLALGILWMIGLMYLTGMKWNLFNIVVLPSIIGIGVDNGVHIYHRYKEEGPGSLLHVLKTTGLAVTMTTATTIVGYSGLVIARHPGLNSIGNLAVIGLVATYLAAVVVLPAALQFMEDRTKSEAAKNAN